MHTHVDAGALAGLKYFVFELLAHLGNNLFDTGGMDASVDYELMKGQTGDFTAYGIEGGEHDGIGSIVHNYFNTGGRLEGADVTAFTPDDTTFHFIVVDGESGNGVLDCSFRGSALYGIDYYALSLFRSIQACVVHRIVYVRLGFSAGLCLQILHQHVLCLDCRHAGNGFKLLVHLGNKAVAFFLLALEVFHLGTELTACAVDFMLPAPEFTGLLAELGFLLMDCVFALLKLLVLVAYIVFVFAFQLHELLFRL